MFISDFKVSVISLNSMNLNHINSFLQTNGFFYGQIRNNIKILQKTSIHTTGFYLKNNVSSGLIITTIIFIVIV